MSESRESRERDRQRSNPGQGRQPACLLIFSKPPTPGRVKTRLIGRLSASQAADLHAAFLQDLIEEMGQGSFSLKMAWALAGDEIEPATGLESFVQTGPDLGQRLHRALSAAAESHRWVAAIGSDHPELSASLVRQAFDKLAGGADMVLGPTEDGGYYLIALSRSSLTPAVFVGIPWSTDGVLSTTIDRAREEGLRIEVLPRIADVDTPEDLDCLIARVDENPGAVGQRTRAVLEAWGLLRQPGWRGGGGHESS